jgi:Ser/Thr protein kinase RdoA (MazF antagonist)
MSINGHGTDVWERFIRGYSTCRPLPVNDLATMHLFASIRTIWLMGLWCANAQLFGTARLHDDYLDRELARAKYFYAGA